MFEEAEKFAITFELDLEVRVSLRKNNFWCVCVCVFLFNFVKVFPDFVFVL